MKSFSIITIPVTPFKQNCSILYDESCKKGVLVDPGGGLQDILQQVKKHNIEIESIWLTHGHIDHIGVAKAASRALKAPILGPHQADAFLFESLEDTAEKYKFSEKVENFTPDHWLEEGQLLGFADHSFKVYFTPGHSPGHVIYFNKKERLAVVGDVLFRGSIGRTDLLGSQPEDLMQSLSQKVLPLGDDVDFICGHGPASTIGYEKEANPFIVRLLRKETRP